MRQLSRYYFRRMRGWQRREKISYFRWREAHSVAHADGLTSSRDYLPLHPDFSFDIFITHHTILEVALITADKTRHAHYSGPLITPAF